MPPTRRPTPCMLAIDMLFRCLWNHSWQPWQQSTLQKVITFSGILTQVHHHLNSRTHYICVDAVCKLFAFLDLFWLSLSYSYALCTGVHFEPVPTLLKKYYHTTWYISVMNAQVKQILYWQLLHDWCLIHGCVVFLLQPLTKKNSFWKCPVAVWVILPSSFHCYACTHAVSQYSRLLKLGTWGGGRGGS